MNHDTHTTESDNGDRLMDAVLHEHARLGNQADEFLLTRIHHATTVPSRAKSRPARWIAAAAVAVAAGLTWSISNTRENPRTIAAVDGATNENLIQLATELPAELIEGTPVPINVPRLVGVPTEPPTLAVPAGTRLLSLGKPVTSSDDFPLIGSLDLITDGEKNAGEGYYVELDSGPQWVQIDLEIRAEIHAIWVWHYHSQRRAYHDVVIQISDDPEFKEGVTTVFNNDFDNSSGLGRGMDHPYIESRFGLLVDARGTPGRYIRLHSNGNTSDDANHYIEVEIHGIPKN